MADRFNNSDQRLSDDISLGKALDLFRKRWYLIILSLALALVLSKLYLRYSKPVYVASATVKVDDNSSKFQALDFLDEMQYMTDNIQSEMQILQSRSMILKALDRIRDKIEVSYYNLGTLLMSEMYSKTPFLISFNPNNGNKVTFNKFYSLFYLGGDRFKVGYPDQPEEGYVEGRFGELVEFDEFRFVVDPHEDTKYKMAVNEEFRFKVNDLNYTAQRVRGGLVIDQLSFNVSIIKITYKDFVPAFASDFVNALSQVYVEENRNIKTQAASQALEFIKGQVDSIRTDVEDAEKILGKYKSEQELISVDAKANMDLEEMVRQEQELQVLELTRVDIGLLEAQLSAEEGMLTLPVNLQGLSDPVLLNLIQGYNTMIQEKVSALEKYRPSHQKILELNKKLDDLRSSIRQNVQAMKRGNAAKLQLVQDKINKARGKLKLLPETQREFISLSREYEVKEKILNVLLEKQAEASIAEASIVSNVWVVDKAITPRNPISPISLRIYILGVGLGLFGGVALVILTGLLKSTITYREEVEHLSETPIIGVVRRSGQSAQSQYPQMVSLDNPKSSLAESIRGIRTNLQFIVQGEGGKVVSITSTVSGEGKSFIAINLAGIISLLNKKVVILDMDLRRPKLHFSMGNDNSKGLSTYLTGQHSLEDVLIPSPFNNIDIITSGPIPPNPAELAQSQAMRELIAKLRTMYDIVIIDTPPVGLVTDSISLLKQSDVSLYVLRAEYSKRTYAKLPDQLHKEHEIKNLYLILNSVRALGGHYGGYGYKVYASGYYSDDQVEPWWKFWKGKKRK